MKIITKLLLLVGLCGAYGYVTYAAPGINPMCIACDQNGCCCGTTCGANWCTGTCE